MTAARKNMWTAYTTGYPLSPVPGVRCLREVSGRYVFTPHFKILRECCRIDLLLILGGRAIGVECKAPRGGRSSGVAMHLAHMQALDYVSHGQFNVDGQWLNLDWCAVAPAGRCHNFIAGFQQQNRLASLSDRVSSVSITSGEQHLVSIECGARGGISFNKLLTSTHGRKTGSR